MLRFGNKKALFGINNTDDRFYAFLTNKIYQSKEEWISTELNAGKKINAVLEAFKEDNRISAIEKDLLLGYVH